MPKLLVIHPEKCTACRACELACSMKHHNEFNLSRSRIQVNIFLEEAVYIPATCTQCDHCLSIDGDPECVKFCTPKALEYLDEDTEVRMRQMATALKLRETYAEVVA